MSVALIVLVAILVILLVILFATVKVAREYERGVIFRLGRLLPQPKGPGLFLLIPVIDRMEKVDLRTVTLNVPPQEVITKDNVPVRVNAVAYFRIVDANAAIVQVENYMNPWLLEEGASGSSAGPGAATAAGLVGFSIGRSTRR